MNRAGLVLNYRTGNSVQHSNMMLIRVLDDSEPYRMIGHRVEWPADNPKIKGRIVGAHGRKGVLKAILRRGLPGAAINTKIMILDAKRGETERIVEANEELTEEKET